MNHLYVQKYPRAWKKISACIRRLAQGTCEWCHESCQALSVHHLGAPLATGKGWKNGNPCDKHDVRRENLVALCWHCHSTVDQPYYEQWQAGKAKRAAKRERHAAIGIGTGLVCVEAAMSSRQRSVQR
jgi:hypothetical protein